MKTVVVCLAILSIFALFAISYAQGPGMVGPGYGYGGYGMGPDMMGPGYGYGGYGMGPGYGYGGYGMGPGMMGPGYGYGGYGMGPGMMGPGYGYGGYGMGPGMMWQGYGHRGYGPRRGYIQSKECQKFLDDTAKLRKELHDKRFEYSEAIRNSKTSPETITGLEKEIGQLQENIYSKAPQGCW
jgi:hypothetical protein